MEILYSILIHEDGRSEIVEVPKKVSLAWIQRQVGGYIEALAMRRQDMTNLVMVVDEEGKLKGKAVNPVATRLCGYDTIVGKALIMKARDEDLTGMRYTTADFLRTELGGQP